MSSEDFEKTAYIKMRTSDLMEHIACDLDRLYEDGFRYVFMGENLDTGEGFAYRNAEQFSCSEKWKYDLAHTKWMCKYHIIFTPKL